MASRKSKPHAPAELACACAAVRRTARVVTQLYDETLREHHIEGAQFALLAMIGQSGECTQASLAERFDFDKTTISRNLRLLARKKWIAFARGEDARERRVRLTPTGRTRLDAAKPAWRAAQDRLRGAMSRRDWNAMLALFGRVTTAARAARPARSGPGVMTSSARRDRTHSGR